MSTKKDGDEFELSIIRLIYSEKYTHSYLNKEMES